MKPLVYFFPFQAPIKLALSLQAESEQFPGQFHRWILSRFLIKGQLKVQESFLCEMAKAAFLMGKQILKIVKSKNMVYAQPAFMAVRKKFSRVDYIIWSLQGEVKTI